MTKSLVTQSGAAAFGLLFGILTLAPGVRDAPVERAAPAAAVAAQLRYVAREITYEPYAGALRGPRGTAQAKAGNDVDRALLLRERVRTSEPTAATRFAFGTLTAVQAEARLVPPAIAVPRPTPNPSGWTARLTPKAQGVMDAARADLAASASDATRDSLALQDVLDRAVLVPQTLAQPHSALILSARNHVWLQYRQGDDWVDLDPAVSEASPGNRLCNVDRVADDLPEDVYHHLSINVILEERRGGQSASRFLLESDWRTADLSGSSINLAMAEVIGLQALAHSPRASPGGLSYTPILIVDDEPRVGDSFVLPRLASADLARGTRDGTTALGSAVGRMLGGHAGQAASRTNAASSSESVEIAGIWLQIVVAPVSGAPEVVERAIVDRIGYAARAAGLQNTAPLSPWRVTGGDYEDLRTIWNIATWSGEDVSRRSASARQGRAGLPEIRRRLEDASEFHHAFYALRTYLFEHGGSPALPPLVRESDVSVVAWRLSSDPSRDGVSIDLVRSQTPWMAGSSPKGWRAAWGQATLYAERLLMSSIASPGRGRSRETFLDVAAIFGSSRGNQSAVVLRPGDADRVDRWEASTEAKARLRGRLTEGRAVVVPPQAVTLSGRKLLGWWLVDVDTGFLIDEMETGRHQSSGEYSAANKEESEKNVAAARAGSYRKFAKAVCLAARLVALTEAGVQIEAGVKAGDPIVIEEAVAAANDAGEGIAECEGEKAPLGQPVGEPDVNPDNPWAGRPAPKFPRPSNAPRPRGPYLPKQPPFRGMPRGR